VAATATAVKTATPLPTATAVPTKKPAPRPTARPKPKATPAPQLLSSDLKGRVWMGNSPVKNVRLRALSKHTAKVYEVKTDSNGSFVFKALPIGAYVISVEATYIKEKALAVTVVRGVNKPLVISVQKR